MVCRFFSLSLLSLLLFSWRRFTFLSGFGFFLPTLAPSLLDLGILRFELAALAVLELTSLDSGLLLVGKFVGGWLCHFCSFSSRCCSLFFCLLGFGGFRGTGGSFWVRSFRLVSLLFELLQPLDFCSHDRVPCFQNLSG